MARIKFKGALGTVDEIPLFLPPRRIGPGELGEQHAGETDDQFNARVERFERFRDVGLRFRYVDSDVTDVFAAELRAIAGDESVRLAELRRQYARDVRPELHGEDYRSPEGAAAYKAQVRRVIGGLLVGMSNLDVGETRVEDLSLPEVISFLERMHVAEMVMQRLLQAQVPTPAERLPSGP